ncbi:MAG TPA: Ig-like domain-containing protein, partial [Gemmatimonadaceae bacterium]|nr:Ig-like domain-containing protein [Gemmatimonadaceae bacterium]
ATVNATVYRAVANVQVSPNPFTMQVGFDHVFSYTLKASNDNTVPQNATSATWSSSNASIVTVDQSGRVTAKGLGTTTVKVTTAEGVIGASDVTVEPIPAAPVARVVVTPASVTLRLSDAKCQFTAKAFDANGNEVQVSGFRWLVDDSSVASVDTSGLVTFKTAGTTTIRAFYGNASDAPGGSGTLTININP